MIFVKIKIKIKFLVWCDDPPEDRVISIFAGCLANHDRTHSLIITRDYFTTFSYTNVDYFTTFSRITV